MRPQLEQLEDRCSPGGLVTWVLGSGVPWNPGTPPVVHFSAYAGEAAGSAGTAESYDGLPWHLLTRLDHHLLKVYRAFHPIVKRVEVNPVYEGEGLPMPEEIKEEMKWYLVKIGNDGELHTSIRVKAPNRRKAVGEAYDILSREMDTDWCDEFSVEELGGE